MVCSRARVVVRAAACSVALFLASAASQAATILSTGVVLQSPPGSSVVQDFPIAPAPNNDDVTAPSPNGQSIAKAFGALGVLDVEYTVANSGGITEYFINEGPPGPGGLMFGVTNNTGTDWAGYRFELGFGSGAGFVPSSLQDELDFDAPGFEPPPVSDLFPSVSAQADLLEFGGATLPDGATVSFLFSLDVPDFNAAMPAGAAERDATGAVTGYRFTLRQSPITPVTPVPEPTSLVLLASGLAALAARRQRLRR
jgi:hypothetical protein